MTHLLELTGDDIAQLDDTGLRALIGKLCESHLAKSNFPASAVRWGGDQNARDGGLDVRVSLPAAAVHGFIPRPNTGFQVKHADMPRSAIADEMRPNGNLRELIAELADQAGCYIIASAQGSITETAWRDRIAAMRAAVADHPNAEQLLLDFYDRNRIASWVGENPSVVPWLRERIGKALSGWYGFGAWPGAAAADAEYFADSSARIFDQRSPQEEALSVVEGIDRIRAVLASPGAVARLVGLSGTGKTRLVQALFDERVGHHAPSPTLAIYCDFAHDPVPTPAAMIQQLQHKGVRAIVIVDNCPPEAHKVVTSHTKATGSSVSALTVEFDVADDSPEETEVFRLEPASSDVIERLLRQRLPRLSDVDLMRIVEFSGGNARIALALGAGVRSGESISKLADRDLFRRLFEQRQGATDSLMRAAEVASLVYSFNADTELEAPPELTALAELAGTSVDAFFRNIKALQDRDLVQRRGTWRALLPQALADRLAPEALSSILPSALGKTLNEATVPRLLTSFTRRLGYLHDSPEAQQLVRSWLAPDGSLGVWDGAALSRPTQFENVAPVAPEVALAAMERWASGPSTEEFLAARAPNRSVYIRVLTAIAYEAALFPRAAWVLAMFAARESANQKHNGAWRSIAQLCRIKLSVSGTQPASLLIAGDCASWA